MSYDALDDKQAEIEDGINSDPFLGELSCKVASQCLKELIAELRSLRAECERLKARPAIPNLDAMTFQELRLFHMQLDALDGYQFARRRVLADKADRSIEAEQWYAALPPWAKFREE